MTPAPIPENETDRLAALARYGILDTASEKEYDDFTFLAAQICGTPIALISLLDAGRQWFKSKVGLDANETPRDISFCGHAILGDELFEVPNALDDERFKDNPLVTGNPDIRFYAGMPLTTGDGYSLGTLCVIDHMPRHLTAPQRQTLAVLANQLTQLIERRLLAAQMADLNQALNRNVELLHLTGEIASVGGWELELKSMKISWTEQVYRIHEIDPAVEPVIEDAINFYAPEARPTIKAALQACIADRTPWDIELPFITAKGKAIWVRTQGKPIQEDGKVVRLIGAFQDITERKRAADAIEHMAFYDSLTQLPNRRLFLDRLGRAMVGNVRKQCHGALLFIDLDHFKTVNDTLGHDKGDLLLQQVAERLTASVRGIDTVARIGGDEFVVILESLAESADHATRQARLVAEKIQAAFSQPYALANSIWQATSSIGVTLFSGQNESSDDVLKRADLAMYQAKAEGRNGMRFLNPEVFDGSTTSLGLAVGF